MKKMLLVFSLLSPLLSFTQTIGVKTGLALSGYQAVSNRIANPMAPRTNISTSLKPGFVLGTNVDYRLKPGLFLRTGAEVVVKGGVEEGTYTSNGISEPYRTSYNFAAVDFPLLLLYRLKIKGEQQLLLGGGAVPGILIEGGLNKGDLGAGILVGYQFASGLNYNFTYNHGLVNVATHSFDYRTLKNRSLALTLGYQFAPSSSRESQVPEAVQSPVTAQQPANALFAELGGSGGFLSLNYDTRLTKSNRGWGIRVGVGTINDLNSFGFTMPFAFNYLSGERNHFFEAALGATFFHLGEKNQDTWFSFEKENLLAPCFWLGYRYQSLEKRFVFRAGINQFFAADIQGFLRYPFPGLSFGYALW
jgi:hypothetical protein